MQPQFESTIGNMLESAQWWVLIIVMPFFALIPDFFIMFTQKDCFPTPADKIMALQKKNPNYKYDGFIDYDNV